MKIRTVSPFLSFLIGAIVLYACGGSTSDGPNPVPTPVPTPNFPVIMAAGDISCDSATPQLPCKSKETSDLLMSERALRSAVVVLPLGDLQYDQGTLLEFRRNYQTTWGRANEFSHPVTGNHEYETRNAAGYFDYFAERAVAVGARAEGWYQYNVGDWHFIALNSNCGSVGGCGVGSAQYRFLEADLAQNRSRCTVAYMHHPFLSSGQNGSTPELLPLMRLLYLNRVDIVLAGHDHLYERFNPITPEQVPDPERGMRLFTVGTGGRDLYEFTRILPNSAVRSNQTYGVLRIIMKDGGYEWGFVKIDGAVVDPGSALCF
jgi:hypothetical protein